MDCIFEFISKVPRSVAHENQTEKFIPAKCFIEKFHAVSQRVSPMSNELNAYNAYKFIDRLAFGKASEKKEDVGLHFCWAYGNVVIIGVFVVVIQNCIIECFCCRCIVCICVGFAGKLFICHKNWRHIL